MKKEVSKRKNQCFLEKALQKRKMNEDKQKRCREDEMRNWEKAMSGELNGERKTATIAKEIMSKKQRLAKGILQEEDNNFHLYTAMHKSALKQLDNFSYCECTHNFNYRYFEELWGISYLNGLHLCYGKVKLRYDIGYGNI